MIIAIIAAALIQCITRTQAGWSSGRGTAAVSCAAMLLDMVVSDMLKRLVECRSCPMIRGTLASVTGPGGISFM
jgi:hypothetical protein